MPTFEPLRPRGSADDLTLDSPLESEPTFSPLAPERPAVNRPMVSNVGDQLPSPFDVSGDFAGLGSPVERPDGLPKSFRSDALHNIGVNWAEGTSGEQRPFTSKLGFYDLDYDTKGRRGVELGKGADYIEAANVFGRQFTRAELEKDDEGRKLIKLMEAQRTGSHQEAGFWKGVSDWNLGNVPWLGWMMDVGSTVSETISISKTMRKMQNGEAVSNHEAIAVRRFMLQQELESQRSTSYQIGSTIRSSVPFVVEIAGAAAMTAAAAKVGAWVGGAIAGIGSGGVLAPVGAAVGGAIGAVGGFIFGGGVLLSKLFKGGAKKAATKFATNTVMESLAERTLAEGITQAERRAAVQFAAGATGRTAKEISNAALQTGMVRASESIGRELAERKLGSEAVKGWTAEQFAAYAVKNAASKDIRKRAVFEASKWVGESFKDVADIAMDARLARTFLVNGDVANMVERGWVTTLEKAALDKVYGNSPRTVKDGFWIGIRNYWADRAAVRGGLDRLTGEEINALKQQFLTSMMDKAAGRPSAVSAVTASISQSLGGHAVSRGYASDVAEYLVNNATRSFMLKYKGKGFVNGATRVSRWIGDGILDGMLRWDTSIYHGAGTIARSGSVLGGKMAAFKEALKVSFVEAPVRGTMQLGMQMPMWPVAAAVTGNDPRDFVVRGQLGTQATALQTGDRQMMDNARAIAIGSGLVEYISEASGRGFNIMMEGIASPVLKNAPFFKATKEIGSYMSRKLESVFGTQEMMKYANRSRLVDAVSGYLGRKAAEGVRLPNITRTQVEQLVAGVKDVANVGEVLNALGLKSEKALVKQAMVSQLGLSKMRAGMTYFVAHNMLERGLTPQKMAAWLQRVGYDGVVAEMAEERYGGFFQGLMGLDDSPSDSTMRDRWSAAMRGLFPDPHQLVVEAASFSFPAMTQLTMNSLYSHLGRGVVQETLDDARSVSVHQNTVPEFTMPVASAEGAQALAAYHSGAQALYDKATIGEGGEEAARAAISARAQAVKSAVADGSLTLNDRNKDISNASVSDDEMQVLLSEKAQRIIDLSNTEEELNKQLSDHQAEEVFGADGVEAIRRLWRKDPTHMDSVKQKALGEGSEYAEFVKNAPNVELRPDADADSVASEITAALPFVSNDSAMTAEVRERLSVRQGVQFNKFSGDYVGEVAGSLGRLGDKYLQFKYNLGRNQWWGRRALMRVIGILDAITTGRLELASRNPVQWAMEEAQLPRQLMNEVGQLRERAIQAGRELYLRRRFGNRYMNGEEARKIRETPLADMSADLMEEFRKAGEESYQTSLRDYAQMFLTARNVIAVSKGDIEDAALRVVAHNHRDEAGGKVIYRYGDKTTDDFRSVEFRAAVAGEEMEKAKSDIVKGLARLAVGDAVAINTHARFGNVNTTSVTFSYDRAMRFGNNAEVVAAIRAMPAFRNMRAVYDVSDGGRVNDYALGRTIDVGELLNLNTDGMLEPGDLRRVMFAMGRYYGEFTESQNQQAAAQYLSRLRLAVENSEPLSFEFRDGTSADVKTSYGLDKDGRRVVTLTCNGVSVTGRSTLEAARLLETAVVPKADGTRPEVDGVLANWRQFAVLQNDSISSRDATSLVLLMHGTREKAREAYRAFYGHDVDEALYPPQLRRVTRGGIETWLYEDEEEAARGLATELRSEDEGVRNAVRGNGREGDPMSIGYERAAELMLERHGITRSKQDAAATDVYRGDASYSIRPNGIAFGDTIYLQSDYYSGGDAEMMLRSAFARAIFDAATKPGKAFDDPSAFVGILQEMDRAFTKAADECVAELEDRNPDMAQRVKDAMASLPSSPGRVDPARMAAIAAAVGIFSDERGVNEYGNGFLFGPELAYVADRARRSPWTLLFLSSMDEALGGRGFFAEDADPLQGLGRFVDAFAPGGPELMASRASAMFTNGGEGARKTGIVFQWYGVPKDISAAGIAAGIAPVVDESTLTNFTDVTNFNVRSLLSTVARHCREFGDAYRKAGGTISNAEMYRLLKHALAGGGETADEVAPSIGSGFGGVSLETDARVRQPLASDIVPDDVAFGIGRNLQFLAPGAEVGGVGGRARALKARYTVRRFLFERGCYSSNAERIFSKFVDAAGAEGGAGVSDAALDEEEWTSLADVLSDGSGNQDIFFDAKRANAAIENRDLMDLGRQWSYIYPSEGGAFTQVLARFSNEILRLAEKDEAADELKTLARLFNVLRYKRSGKSGGSISAATGVWNDSSRVAKDTKITDALLAKAIVALHASGHDELAFVLNGIRNIPAEGKRRAQALALIGYMTPLDVNRVTVGDTGIGAFDTMGSAGLAAVSSVRASLSHTLSRMFPRVAGGHRTTPDELYKGISVLDNLLLLSGSEKFFEKDKAGTPFSKLTIAEYESILANAREGSDAKDAFTKNPSDDKALVAFANALASRMSAVADAVDYVLGPGNELTYALRSPDIVGGVVRSVRNAKDDSLKNVVDRLVQLFDSCAESKESGSRCPLISHALLNPAIAAIQRAVAVKGGTPLQGRRQYSDITTHGLSAVDILNALSDDRIARLFSRGDPMPQGAPRSKWFKNRLPGGVVNSYMGRVFGLYAASAPRSVARMSGVREESLEASSQVTAAPASEPVMMAAVEDRLLAKLPAGTVKTINVWAGSGENAEFSNLAERPFTYDGRNYLSVEHAYQTLKSGTFDEDTYGKYTHAGVKIKGRLRADTRINVKLMQDLVYESFRQNPEQAKRLVDTGSSKFTHTQARDLWVTEFPKALELAREKLGRKRGSVLDDYLARGGRFEDGSRLVVVTAGARLEDGTIVDKSQLSVIVATANIDRFVKGDVRNGYFEVYHGEKPSVYSISLPRDVMQKILDGIHSGADWAMNRVTRKMLEDKEYPLPKTIDAPDNRERLYDALFSVVATSARCDQIDPKRTQVLLAQGVPFSTHRDRMLKTVDGKVEEASAAVSTMDGKAKVTPGLYCDIIVSGTDAAQNLGMYLNHGFLIESQRAQATNPLSVSFKNHLIDWFGAALFKGQGHDFGLGMYETDAVPVSGTLAEACRVQRRRLEEILGIKELTLDLPDPENPQTDEEKAYRESALKLVEEFFISSTTLCTDTETLKAGAFSSRCGFKAEKGKPFTVKAGSKEIVFQLEERDGKPPRLLMTVDGQKVRMFGRTMVTPEFKNGGAPLSTMLPAVAFALGKKELSDEDVGSIEAEWLLPTGETTEVKALKDSGIFQSYGTEEGDKVSVVESSSGGYRVRYFTRSMNAQVMANSDASAKPSLEHPAATNWARDVVANSGRVRRAVPGQADFTWYATKALNVSRAVPYAILRSQPDFVRSLIERDSELYAAWMAHPNSQEVQEQIVRRANTAYAKAMRAYVNSMHAVLMGSGIKATKTDRQADGTYNVEYSYSAGVTDYDKGCFRDARVLSQEEKEAFGVGRSYSSGQVNVLSANFRYGWHVKADADFSAIDAYAQGAGRKAYEANLSRLEQAYGDVDEDMKRVASLAAYIEYFDGPSCRGEAKEAAAKVLGSVFTDYTGKTVGENASCDIMKLSFSDLFLGQRYGGSRFDLAAFEFRGDTHGKKYDRNGNKTIYLGGAFFAGDRRPSGNFESAGGLIRVQAPVLFDRATGKVDGHALYILPPLMNLTQGSDTDGDSATGTVMSGRGLTADDRLILDQIHDTVMARMKDLGSDEWTRLLRCEDLVNTLRTRFPDYFEEETDGNGVKFMKPSARLHQLIGNVLLQEEIDNYRLMPNETQTAYGTMDVNKAASSRTIYDYGLIGRSPVGTQAVSDDIDIQIGGAASRLAATVLDVPEDSLAGKSYYSVFKKCIDKLSLQTMPELDLLNPRVAAYLSGAAADANGARGVMVSLQAALEHLMGYADVDPRVRALAPALFEEYNGYRPAEDFIGHLDKISNALFDVVKDLFAPRAGWQKGLLNCLMAKLLSDANAAYAEWESDGRKGTGPRWDDEWFFTELVGFAQELHSSDTSLPSLVAKGNAFFDHAAEDAFLPGQRKQTLLGAYNDMVIGKKDCIAKTAFLGMYMVRDGQLDLTSKGRPKDVSKQYRLREGLNVMDEESGEMVPAHGADVQKGIAGLMSSIARALRMRESGFADAEARDRALALGWRPATDFMDEALCDAIADVMEGKVDGRTAVRDRATKIAIGLRFLSATDVNAALNEAQRDLRALQTLNDIMEAEDGLSPEAALRNGGTKAAGHLGKMERAQKGGAAVSNEMELVYIGSKLRFEDIASGRDPLSADRSVRGDLDAVELSPSDWSSYLSRTGQKPMSATDSQGNPANDEALLFMAAASFAGDYVDTGVVQANRLNLSHILGCVRSGVQKFGGAQYSQFVLGNYGKFASALNSLVEEALNRGTAAGMSQNVVDMLTMLRPNVTRNTVDLVIRASSDATKVLRAGFQELAANQNAVGGGFTGAGLAACIQLSMCANSQFDPARDSNVRANVSAMFGEEVDEWERWGAAVPQNPVLRQLCRVPRLPSTGGYNLFVQRMQHLDPELAKKVAAVSGMPEVTDADLNHPATQSLTTPFAVLNYIAMTDYTSPHALHDEAAESDPRFLPGGEQRRRLTSVYAEGESHALRPQTSVPNVMFRGPSGEFQTVEEAVNDIMRERLASYASDKRMAAWLADPRNLTRSFNQARLSTRFADESDREMYAATGRAPRGTVRKVPLNFDNVIDEVLERTWIDYGEQFAEWARNAAFDGGETLSEIASPLMRGKLKSFVQAHAETALEAPSIGSAPVDPTFTVQRMRRGGFFQFLEGKHPEDMDRFVHDPEVNIRGALEAVFGDWSKETGCKVERVTGKNDVPMNLIKVTRKVKDAKGIHEVTTYISYGDYLSMKVNNANYNQAILNALNERADQKMTMDELMSLTEEERVALANAAGLRVKGESVKASKYLGTKSLMALSGLVRLSDVSDYHTLFHEYFHQMLDFYRKTGICTAEDEAELLKKYRTADGRFDEEAAADAFADYVTRTDEGTGRGKVLSAGFGGDDKLFAKFKRTAQAFLSGAMAYDAGGMPVFMNMMISADFSQRDMKEMQDFDDAQQKKIERLLLGENVDFGAPSRWESVDGELKDDGYALANALTMYKGGLVGIDEVKAAARKFVEDGRKPENRVTFNAVMNIDRPPAPSDVAKPEPGPTLAQRISDPAIPIGDRVSLLFKEALKRLGNGTSESVDLTEAMNKFRDLSDIGEAAGPDFDLATYTARRALNHVCEMLGVNIWDYAEDGTKLLNDLGRQLMADEKIAGLIVRLVHEYSVKRTSENDYAGDLATVPTKDMGTWGPERPVDTITPAQFASADYVMGNMLAGVVPSKWTEFCRGRAEASRDLFIKAAEDLEARAAAMRSRFPNGDIPEDVERDAKWLELQGADARHRAHDVVTLVEGVMNGYPLKGLILAMGPEDKNTLKPRKGWSSEQEFSNYYGYLLQYITGAARMERQNDGTVRYAPGKAFGFHNAVVDFSSRFVQEAIDAAAKALGVAQVVRRYVKENGVDQPAPGEPVSIPVDADGAPLATPPVEGVLEPDLHPQLILQLPGSWQASDLQKQFYGGSFRDMMTDVSLNAAVEETNRLANRIDFYLGANCMPGESANEIEEATSELGTEDGLFTAEEKNRHSVRRVAGVRGYLLGLVNRAAKTKGRAMTQEDVNLVHFVSQAIACHACGHAMYTGYDIPYVNRTMLDGLLANVKNVAELEKATAEGGVYSPKAVLDRIYGHVSSAGRPSNLDQLLCRVLEGVPRSVLGWENGKFRKEGIYCRILEAFYITGRNRTDGTQVGDYDFNQRVGALLMEAGLSDRSAATGRVVLTIPVAEVKRAWEAKDSYRQELIDNCGRRAELLDIDYLAEVVAAEANRLNKVAGRSRWLTDSAVGTTLSGMARGLWFEAGTGHHQAIVDHLKNARELFRGEISPDERLRNSYAALQDTLRSHNKEVTHRKIVTGPDGTPVEKKERVVQGNLPAFELGRDGQLANISNRQLMYLGRLLGLGRRMADVDTFIKNIFAGNFTKEKTGSIYGFDIRKDMTVFEFDWLMFNVLSAHIVTEAEHPDDPGHTPLTQAYDEGGCGYGHQQLVDIYYLHGQLQQKLMDDSEADGTVRGRVCSMSEQDMFRTQGKLGSAKSATERLRSMAEAITHAERFRGCLAQMLTTVGTDGAPNFIVKPGEYAQDLVPDEFWQATSRFVLDRMRGLGKMVAYDAGKTGLENMRTIADAAAALVRNASKDGAKPRYHLLPPNELGADSLFDSILCADDDASDDVNVLTKFANGRLFHPNGSEAEGYMRQLFGMVSRPTVWAGHRILDRVMSYSKAASVGLSAFFAFATRFESPVAACGFWNTAMGYRKNTAKLARRLAGSKIGEALGFRKNLPYLADFLEAITSDDPAIQHMRELCDLINMPLTDSVMNPLTEKQGAIDADIDRISRWLMAEGHTKMAKELRSAMKAAFHNPGEYAFSNVLNGVKMAVVAQTMFRLREECEHAGRPFDPVRELRRHSAYINAEIGGIQPERYAFLTPGMQQLLRLGMFSYQWTLGAWVAGSGEVVSDILFGGHHTTEATRQRAFVRWLRMLGIVKVGVPVFMQLAIKSLATALVKSGMVGDPDDPDDKDPLGIDDMPWLCFFNESKVGSLAFDITPITKLLGQQDYSPAVGAGVLGALGGLAMGGLKGAVVGAAGAAGATAGLRSAGVTLVDVKNGRGVFPYVSTVVGTAAGAALTRKWWGALAGGFAGRNIGALIPVSEGVGRGANTTGRRRQYMHFGKQNDEFWRWFTDGWGQATNKMSIPLQKVVEAFFGSTNGQNFGKKFSEKSLTERFFTTSLDPNESAVVNFLTGFLPFSAASVAGHPDTGVLGMVGPVNQGTSKTRSQKEIRSILTDFVRDDRHNDPWSFPGNRQNLSKLCALALKEARMNGIDPDELLTSALGQVTSQEYIRLFEALPRTVKDEVDARSAKAALRALYRVNRKKDAILQSLKKKYKNAGVDWSKQKNAAIRAAVKDFLGESRADPWVSDDEVDELFERHFAEPSFQQLRSVDVQQDRKGGEAFSNFLATDDVPETLFGIPVVSQDYTEEDLEFFKRNPKAAGFYDLGDDNDEQEPPPDDGGGGGGGGGGPSADLKGGISGAVLGAEDPDKGKVKTSIPLKALRQDNKGGEADWDFLAGDGGSATLGEGVFNKWGGNLRNDGRKAHLFRDDNGKVTGYGTTASTVVERNGRYYVVPTIVDGNEPMSIEDAGKRFDETGEHWASAKTAEEADRIGRAVHEHGEARYRKLWNEYIQDHWGDMADSLTNDTELADIHAAREYIRNSAGPLTRTAYDFMVKGPGVEGFDAEARLDVNGKYVLGHGAQSWGDRKTKVKEGQKTTWLDAAKQFREDVLFRDNMLRDMMPGYDRMDRNHKAALIDIAFGKEGVLSPGVSKKLHEKLNAAKTRADLHEAVESEYHTYGTKDKGLRNRRIKVAKHLFNKDLSYAQDASGKWIGTYK